MLQVKTEILKTTTLVLALLIMVMNWKIYRARPTPTSMPHGFLRVGRLATATNALALLKTGTPHHYRMAQSGNPNRLTSQSRNSNKHWVMTAAHCVADVRTAQFLPELPVLKTILTGMHPAGKLEPWSQNITILEYIGPSILYNRKGHFSKYHTQDFVLFRLATPIIFSDKVTPVNFPPIDWEVAEDFKENATIIGWGAILEGQGLNTTFANADELQEISLPLITTETCQRRAGLFRYNTTRGVFWESFEAPVFQICLSLRELRPEEPLGACFGDSGSPALVFNSKYATYFQVGIVAYGHCWHDTPYLYTNVAKYVNWIRWNTELCHWRNVSRSYGP